VVPKFSRLIKNPKLGFSEPEAVSKASCSVPEAYESLFSTRLEKK
jgi:hypothetical protein